MVIFETAWRGIGRKILKILSVIALNAIGIVLVGGALFCNDTYKYDERRCEELYKKGNDNTYYCLCSDWFNADKLYSIEEIESMGYFEANFGTIWNDAEALMGQNKEIYKEAGYEDYGYLTICEFMNIDTLKMYNFKFSDELSQEEIEGADADAYIYLGSKYKGIEVGTRYNLYDDVYAVVAGIFEENQTVPCGFDISGDIGSFNDIFVSLDEQIVLANKKGAPLVTNWFNFTLKEGADYDAVKEKIKAAAENENGYFIFKSVSEQFQDRYDNNAQLIGILQGIMAIIIISSIFISSCIMILDIQKNQKMYGIMCANGFTTSDIIKSVLLENGFVMILSVMLALLITLTQADAFFSNKVLMTMTVPKLVLFCIAMIIVSTAVPAVYISRMDTKKMIEGEVI